MFGQLARMDHDPERDHTLDRLATKFEIDYPHTSIRYQSWAHLINKPTLLETASQLDRSDLSNILLSVPERLKYTTDTLTPIPKPKKGWFSNFYRDPHSFFVLDEKNFFLKIDPVFHFEVGDDIESDDFIFQNTRGIKIRGLIDDKVYFYTSLYENQQQFLPYIENEIDRIGVIPGQGFFKPYQSGLFDRVNGWDFLNAQGYVGWKLSTSIDVHFGHGKHFIGNGIRSMLLSDYANNYLYLQLNTRVSIFHLQNTFAELSATGSRDNVGDRLLPKKYMAAHYLSLQVSPKLSLGLFESVIFSRDQGFELQYLNPVILYRTVERLLDSPDNVLLGLNINYIPVKGIQFYGQLLLDELRTDQIFSGQGWWGNKVGYQIGGKAFDLFGIPHLDLQVEANSARPYTYTHRDEDINARPAGSYTHFNQALAHPYGANFTEQIIRIKYRPLERLALTGLIHHADFGDDPTINVGRNILLNNESRPSDTGNFTGQGIAHDIMSLHLTATWKLAPSYFVDMNIIHRTEQIEDSPSVRTNYLGFAFRANISSTRPLL